MIRIAYVTCGIYDTLSGIIVMFAYGALYYAELLGGKISGVFRNADAPDPKSRMLGGDDLVMNMAMTLGNATVMVSDGSGQNLVFTRLAFRRSTCRQGQRLV